jgi:hypothetical protein
MTQVGHALEITRTRDALGWIKDIIPATNSSKLPHGYVEHIREIPQVTTNTAATIEEVSGETIAAMSANKVLNASQKTDQVGTDGKATGVVKWQTSTGALTTATFTLNGSNTTTHVAMVAAVTTAQYIRSMSLDDLDCADEILLSNVDEDEIYGVIKLGYHQLLKSGLRAVPTYRTWIKSLKLDLSVVTAAVTIVCTFTPAGESLSVTKNFASKEITKSWDIGLEVEPGTDVSWTIVDDNAAHPTAVITIEYVEAT